jgi:hypothetical protein
MTGAHSAGPQEGTPGSVAPWLATAAEALRAMGSCPRCGASVPVT